jgi:GNAT superfamily N-acetyltransferase
MASTPSFAQLLPDLPRWVEARAMLLAGSGEISGLQREPELSLVIREPEPGSGFVFVIGKPAASVVRTAVQKSTHCELVAPLEQAAWLASTLPGWIQSRILVHHLAGPGRLPDTAGGPVGFLDLAAISQLPIDPELKAELEDRAEGSPIAATFVEGRPVSFCYAGAITETLWDIAIDTLPEHRRQGYAGLSVAYLVRHMQAQGLQPVWQALEDNPSSWRLAQKLGFVAIDELVLFTSPHP